MTAPIRLSVRALVEFSHFPPDIEPMSPSRMEEGRLAHQARQRDSGASSEVALQWQGRMQGLDFTISGRMDLVDRTRERPLIEEIKLCRGDAPEAPGPAHRAQAVCYAYMLCLQDGLDGADICVSYATKQGDVIASFEETLDFQSLQAEFHILLTAYAKWRKRLLRHQKKRDDSLDTLAFPYPEFRVGQRDMAAQVYTAIARKKRLYAVMPTGTGKSAAVLYPALKALGKGLCRQVFCLTARTTARRAMENEFIRMRAAGLIIHALTLNAREKLCPMEEVRCEAGVCSRAAGHYLREKDAQKAAMKTASWGTGEVLRLSERFHLCPFEFSLSLSTLADAVICDYNYAFDPRVRLQRVFDQPRGLCLLVDEAHNLPERVREMLSGSLNGPALVKMRRQAGADIGRGSRVYRRAGELLKAMREETPSADDLLGCVEELMGALRDTPKFRLQSDLIYDLLGFGDALRRSLADVQGYTMLIRPGGKERHLRLLCLDFTPHLQKVTAPLSGFVCYSATLHPLQAMRELLGGSKEDACFEMPSPFPRDNLLCLQLPVDTRFNARQTGIKALAGAIRALYEGKAGKYIVFFPSYHYMHLVAQEMAEIPLLVQETRMNDAARDAFLARFTADAQPMLALCVLGGIFAEGIDLPGLSLIGVCVVGVGLPQVGEEREAIRAHAALQGQSGFDIAYRYPGMHKVLQAAGRLIRSSDDRGVLLLADDRFAQPAYRRLLPGHYEMLPLPDVSGMPSVLQAFWQGEPAL